MRGGEGDRLHWRVQESTSSPTGIGSRQRVFEVLWKPKEKYVHISMKEVWRNLDNQSKNKELWSYVVSF